MKNSRIYYVGMGSFGYGVFYQNESKETVAVQFFKTFEESVIKLREYQK